MREFETININNFASYSMWSAIDSSNKDEINKLLLRGEECIISFIGFNHSSKYTDFSNELLGNEESLIDNFDMMYLIKAQLK